MVNCLSFGTRDLVSCTMELYHVSSLRRLPKLTIQVCSPGGLAKSPHQVNCSSALTKLTLSSFIKSPHQSASSRSVLKSTHQVSSPSRLTKSARPHVPPSPQVHSPSQQFKCAHQVDSLSSSIKSVDQSVSSRSVFRSAYRACSPSQLAMSRL